jgi:hypothetical protein
MDYLIVYNQQQPNYNSKELHNTVKSLPISDWWHYLPNAYIVRSTHSEKTLADGIIVRNPGLLFLIIKVDLSKANGVLNKSAWDWINNKVKAILKLNPAPSPQPQTLTQLTSGLPSIPQPIPRTPPLGTISDLLGIKK